MSIGGWTCQYKDSLGKPRKGVHSYRIPILDLAAVDVIFTILAAWLFAYYTKWTFWKVLVGLFLLGIVLHRLFCVRTKIDKILTSMIDSSS